MARDEACAGALAADCFFYQIELRDTLECLAGDRRAAAFGNVEEFAAQMRPAEGERDRLAARRAGNVLVGRISIALHDAAVVLEQLERMDTTFLTKLVNLWPASRLDELMPWAWAAQRAADKLAA